LKLPGIAAIGEEAVRVMALGQFDGANG